MTVAQGTLILIAYDASNREKPCSQLSASLKATCGADTVCYYALDIFTASKVDISPYILAIMLQSAFTVGYAISTPLLSRMKRRTQFILSGSIMVASYSVLGVCLYLKVIN